MSDEINTADNPAASAPAAPAAPDYSTMTHGERFSAVQAFLDSRAGAEPAADTNKQPEASLPADVPGEQQQIEAPNEGPANPGIRVPDKFLNPDGTVNLETFAESYRHLESRFGDQGNELGQLRQGTQQLQQQLQARDWQLNNLMAQLQQNQQPQSADVQPSQAPAPEFNTEEWFEKFYENPKDMLLSVIDAEVQKRLDTALQPLQPLQEQAAYAQEVYRHQQVISQLSQQIPDFQEMLPVMAQVLELLGGDQALAGAENPQLELYNRSKQLMSMFQQPPPPEPPAPPSVEQMAANPNVQRQVMSAVAQGIAQNTPPPVLNSRTGSMPSTAPPVEIKSVREGGAAFEAWLNSRQR